MPFLAALNWRAYLWLGVSAAVLGLGVTLVVERAQLRAARAEIAKHEVIEDQLLTAANDNAEVARRLSDASQRLSKIAGDALAANTAIHAKTNTIKRRIADAPVSDDGPIAPVLLRALDELRL